MDLFSQNLQSTPSPLADRMRPRTLPEFVGQEHLVGEGKMLRKLLEGDQVPSMIFWGPPGTGKTTLAKIIANQTKSNFVEITAVGTGIPEVRKIIEKAKDDRKLYLKNTILFVDEIHRFNKAQQDAFLPHVEQGNIILIGATTENPSFEVNSALLSRSRVFVLNQLKPDEIRRILDYALRDEQRGLGKLDVKIDAKVLDYLANMVNGDAREALNALEMAVNSATKKGEKMVKLEVKEISEALQRTHLLYDKTGEEHYNIISALHKSLRGSDVNAALYWLGRMLEGGEDPLYVARRLIRFASEDIGIADPNALTQAVSAYTASHYLGMPECNVILAQAVVYLAQAPKSNKLYMAYKNVQKDIQELENLPVPLHIRNAPTELMKDLGYGKGYKYNPEYNEPVEQDYLPDELKGKKYFDH
ncbi:AAA family ATPase [Candidatus Saccharibacteria bacterium]|nr:replication-associated recombination protein A [Candidatus Saccharibacteria bacterium]NIV03504.1 AAA family ATPase [Calditrichia bacterium]NIS38049.1 replication-associated recombination protein A [Candidatus Saccharibacteria bacterium]NIV71746.1 AAA family ATPase [Calditrichia bacterium]NIV98444.1 AAA family ATPase [Candidatus Saccharibacteria bacterium]